METASVIIKKCLIETNINQAELANMLDKTPQALNNKFYRDYFTYAEVSHILDLLGYELKVVKKQGWKFLALKIVISFL